MNTSTVPADFESVFSVHVRHNIFSFILLLTYYFSILASITGSWIAYLTHEIYMQLCCILRLVLLILAYLICHSVIPNLSHCILVSLVAYPSLWLYSMNFICHSVILLHPSHLIHPLFVSSIFLCLVSCT